MQIFKNGKSELQNLKLFLENRQKIAISLITLKS